MGRESATTAGHRWQVGYVPGEQARSDGTVGLGRSGEGSGYIQSG